VLLLAAARNGFVIGIRFKMLEAEDGEQALLGGIFRIAAVVV
jgi:hypothetical protein